MPAWKLLLTGFAATAFAERTMRSHARSSMRQFPGDDQDDGETSYEHGDRDAALTQTDGGDFSLHQFLEQDDARYGTRGDDSTKMHLAREKAAAADDHFNSEDTLDPNAFVQTNNEAHRVVSKGKKSAKSAAKKKDEDDEMFGDADGYEYGSRDRAVSEADTADYSLHQFLVKDEARDGTSAGDDDSTATQIKRQKAEQQADHFNSEDTPDPDANFVQLRSGHKAAKKAGVRDLDSDDDVDGYEYGSRDRMVTHSDAADFSMHQFLVKDEGRDGQGDDNDGGAAAEKLAIARQNAERTADRFNTEDTLDPDAN